MKTYLEKDYARISYEPSSGSIILQWLTPPTSDEFRETVEQVLSAIQHFNSKKLLADTTGMGAVRDEDSQWVATEWMARAIKAGCTNFATVLPEDVFAQMSLESMNEFVEAGENAKVTNSCNFDNMEAALEWVKKF